MSILQEMKETEEQQRAIIKQQIKAAEQQTEELNEAITTQIVLYEIMLKTSDDETLNEMLKSHIFKLRDELEKLKARI
jgi:hypothetical protein